MALDDEIKNALAMLPGARASLPENPLQQEAVFVPPQSAVRPAPWSKSEVLERLGEDEELLREMCAIFLSESASLLQKLRQAVAGGEAAAVMRAAHSLKGEVSYLSAPAALEAARRLEDMGHQCDIAQAPEALLVLEREMDCLCRSIRAFVAADRDHPL